jgi:hypothetical protein
MSATESGQYRFTVREGTNAPFISAEPAGDALRGLTGLLSFDLAPGTTIEQAQEIAAFMNARISALAITT